MSSYLLRVEAINLGNTIDDTDDLSTRRGGGLLALNVAVKLPNRFRDVTLKPIARGASIGVFEFVVDEDTKAMAVKKEVEDYLKTATLSIGTKAIVEYQYGTFVVDVVEIKESQAVLALAETVAKNRWQQMTTLSCSIAGVFPSRATLPCDTDMIRPADSGKSLPKHRNEGERGPVSKSVLNRHEFGRKMRQQFYEPELAELQHFTKHSTTNLGAFRFSDMLDEIGHPQQLGEKEAPSSSRDKIAVVYFDGNQFGKMLQQILNEQGLDAFQKASEGLRKHHQQLLDSLLSLLVKDTSWHYEDDEIALRLETLLWGGDEIIWVVPAWKGWELAEWFFRTSTELRKDLTYSAGLVFCHTKAPIKNIITLAKRLGDLAKDSSPKDKTEHRLAYEVLESFDAIHGDLDIHRQKWLPTKMNADKLIFDPRKLKDLMPHLRTIAGSNDFPMRQLFKLVHTWRKGEDTGAALKRLRANDFGKAFQSCEILLSDTAWLQLLNMLPYIPEGDK